MDLEINLINLALVATGLFFMSASLHYRLPGKSLEYGANNGFAKNLTTKGKFMFFGGLAIEIAGYLI